MQTTEFNTIIFGQHDPGKTPKGKTSEEEIYYGALRENITAEIATNLSQVSCLIFLQSQVKSSLKFAPSSSTASAPSPR